MYKPRTIEQFKIMEYIKDNFHMECLLVAPVSRSSLMIQDEIGDRMAFQWMDGHVLEAPLPTPASNQEHLAFIKAFWADPRHPQFMSFDDLTTWWLNNPTPLTHQQILNLPDDLYCRYLECEQLLELDDVLTLVMKERITQTEYQDIRLWFLNGHNGGNWLGLVGVDGDGDRYDLVFNYISPHSFHYKLRTETTTNLTARQFFKMYHKGRDLAEIDENMAIGEVIEIDNGLRPYFFFCYDYSTIIPVSTFYKPQGEEK